MELAVQVRAMLSLARRAALHPACHSRLLMAPMAFVWMGLMGLIKVAFLFQVPEMSMAITLMI